MDAGETTVRFGDLELNTGAFRLSRDGEEVRVEPQVFEVLSYLVTNRDRVVAKTELLDNVWGDRFVSESALTSRIKSARQAVGDDGRSQRVIRTVHGRGYQFVADAEVVGESLDRSPTESTLVRRDAGDLIGRDADLEAVWSLIGQQQLVTVLGAGGVGKTRLATEIARIWESEGNRAVFVALEPLTDPDLLAAEIFDALGIRSDTEIDLFSALAEAFRDDESPLLVLDNFEHLTDGAAHVARLNGDIAQLHVLVTSRERLRLSGEHIHDLNPLSLDSSDGNSPAAALFESAAQRAKSDFQLTPDNSPTVDAICAVVDGLPLAIELAAAQLHYLPLDYLLSHLESNVVGIGEDLADRPQRQRSVNDLIGWSYALLTPSQQDLLARLSVFRGGWSLAGAAAIGRLDNEVEALTGLRALIDKSLVRPDPQSASPRFGMLNLIRHFAESKLDSDGCRTEAEQDHTDFVVTQVRETDEGRWGTRAGQWREDAAAQYSNTSAVLERALKNSDARTLGRIVGDLNVWWYRMGRHFEGRRFVAEALAVVGDLDAESRGRVLLGAGFMAVADRKIDDARNHYLAAIEASEEAGDWRYLQYARSLITATELTDPQRFDQARARINDVIEQARSRGETGVLAAALNIAGVLNHRHGHYEQSTELLHSALEANQDLGDRYQQCMNLGNLGLLTISEEKYDDALAYCQEALHIAWRIGSPVMSAWLLAEVAHTRQLMGQAALAARILGTADSVLESLGAHHGPTALQSQHEETVAELLEALGADRFEELNTEGRKATLESTVELALDNDHEAIEEYR